MTIFLEYNQPQGVGVSIIMLHGDDLDGVSSESSVVSGVDRGLVVDRQVVFRN